MRILILIFIHLFSASLLAQEEPEMTSDLGIGHELTIGGSSVKFIEVLADSRCPKTVTCIWPGEAKVLLGIQLNEKYFEKELVVSGTGAEFEIAEDLQVLVSQLRPYPQTAMPLSPEDYCLKIALSQLKEN